MKYTPEELKEYVKTEILNFILWNWSDDTERQRESENLDEYMREDYREVKE